MAKKRGYCNNVDGECSLAEEKTIQEADKTNFVCSECGKPLVEMPGGNTGSGPALWKKIALGAGIVVIIGGLIFLFSDNEPKQTEPIAPFVDTTAVEVPAVDTTAVEKPIADSTAFEEPIVDVEEDYEPVAEQPVKQTKPKQTTQKPTRVQNGYGTIKLPYGTYTGDIKNGKPHGHGKLVYNTTRKLVPSKDETVSAGDWFEGEFRNGYISGPGSLSQNGNVSIFKP